CPMCEPEVRLPSHRHERGASGHSAQERAARQCDTLTETSNRGRFSMPIIILLILAALVATFGFWDTVQGILGAIGVVILMIVLFAALIAAVATMMWRRGKRRLFDR